MPSFLSSDYLFHFTDSFDVIKLILKNGLKVSECSESLECFRSELSSQDFSEFGFDNEAERLIDYAKRLNPDIKMICFCDIPPKLATEHMQDYGSYGIVFSKEWGAKNDINPVLYINTTPSGKPLIAHHLTILYNQYLYNKLPLFDRELQVLFSNTKPYEGINPKTGKFKRFYDEREWRFIPGDANWNLERSGDEQYLKFSLSEVEYIIVKHELEKVLLTNFLVDFHKNNVEEHINKIKLIEELQS